MRTPTTVHSPFKPDSVAHWACCTAGATGSTVEDRPRKRCS
jgi:hypothetical protein